MHRVATAILFTAGLAGVAASGCSIENTQRLGASCLQTRECVTGLVCMTQPDGQQRCSQPIEGGLPGSVDAAGTTSDAPASSDADAGSDAAPPG